MPKRDRYASGVAGTEPEHLAPKMRASIDAALVHWPAGTIVTLFVMDAGGPPEAGLAYISNGDRADMINVVREWLKHQERLS